MPRGLSVCGQIVGTCILSKSKVHRPSEPLLAWQRVAGHPVCLLI